MSDTFKMNQGLGHQLEMAFARNGWTNSLANKVTEGNFLSGVRNVLEGRAKIVPLSTEQVKSPARTVTNFLTVQPYLSTAERVIANNCDYVDRNFTDTDFGVDRFPHRPETVGEWEFDFYLPRSSFLSIHAAKAVVEVDGWILASWEHLLAYGADFPEVRIEEPILALGSVGLVHGQRMVLKLVCEGTQERRIKLHAVTNKVGFSEKFHYFRVRKLSASIA